MSKLKTPEPISATKTLSIHAILISKIFYLCNSQFHNPIFTLKTSVLIINKKEALRVSASTGLQTIKI